MPRWRPPTRVHVGMRVQLRIPIASPHTTWIPAGATGVVVGGDTRARQVSVELDTPRTVITVPWSWLEEEPEPAPGDGPADSPASPDTSVAPPALAAGAPRHRASAARKARVRRGR